MTTDASGNIVLFGGTTTVGMGAATIGDTWVWNSATRAWGQHHPSKAPMARHSHAMAATGDGKVVLFGGYTGGDDDTVHGDTWVWDGTNWTEQEPDNSPPARYRGEMANTADGKAILFGGVTGSGRLADTWIWDGTNWTKQEPDDSPTARYGHGMALTGSGTVLLFGGYGGSSALGDTWLWNGSNWAPQSPGESPSIRYYFAISELGDGNVVVFSGSDAGISRVTDTWVWNHSSSTWHEQSPLTVPIDRFSQTMAMTSDGNALLFSGIRSTSRLADTWLWSN